MLKKQDIIDEALRLGFADIGFTSAEPFEKQREILLERQELYAWAHDKGMDLLKGTNPREIFPPAKSIIVLIENYFQEAFPPSMVGKFGRCYMSDDRITKDTLSKKTKAFRNFLRDNGINSKAGINMPHRLAAARAGLGTFGKNCLFYSNKSARQSSWVFPAPYLLDQEFAPDTPCVENSCPKWCKNACIAACPTGALLGPNKIDPRKCISYLSYYCENITPMEYREAMGMKIYGCDRCQEVCPRNEPWLAQELPVNNKIAAWAEDFDLSKLLHMDKEYYKDRVWPHMFYMPAEELWRFQMNVARAMGNSLEPKYIDDLKRCLTENSDKRVTEMAAWALEKIS